MMKGAKATVRGRIEFTEKVKSILACRASYLCSFPGCQRNTIGPGFLSDEVCKKGEAAHIFSASQDGPRGQGEMTPSFLASVDNGIWLCTEHSKLVDANRGDQFPPEMLRRFKSLHEARIRMQQGNGPFAWVDTLAVHSSRVFAPESTLRLSKVLLIVGENGFGKTFLFRMLDAISIDSKHNPGKIFSPDENLAFSIRLSNPEPHTLTWRQNGQGYHISLDGKDVPFNPLPVNVFFQVKACNRRRLEEFLGAKRREHGDSFDRLDDVLLLAEYFGLSTDLVRKLLPKVGTLVEHAISDVRVVEQGGFDRILVNDKKWRNDAPLHKISGGMLEMLALDMMILRALLICEYTPVLLLLNLTYLHLDRNHMNKYVEFFLSERVNFQTLISSVWPTWLESKISWARIQLRRGVEGIMIEDVF